MPARTPAAVPKCATGTVAVADTVDAIVPQPLTFSHPRDPIDFPTSPVSGIFR